MGVLIQTRLLWVIGLIFVVLGWTCYTASLHFRWMFLPPLAFAFLIVGVPLLSVGLSGMNQEALFEDAVEQLRAEFVEQKRSPSVVRKQLSV
mmetsp:Transcript_19973/g.29087  ORF Transcript_19973/g.29087 Transcript_19973/m.29087 type:complete len:92 (+) Transcript_19973:145-420(+)